MRGYWEDYVEREHRAPLRIGGGVTATIAAPAALKRLGLSGPSREVAGTVTRVGDLHVHVSVPTLLGRVLVAVPRGAVQAE